MARKPSSKPWFHQGTGFWCATVHGKREYLDKDFQAACRKLKALRNQARREQAGGREWLDAPFSVLADEFMANVTRQTNPQPRIIPLPDAIVEMCKELARQPHKPADRVFLNKFGRP